jgi:hypothetical protein
MDCVCSLNTLPALYLLLLSTLLLLLLLSTLLLLLLLLLHSAGLTEDARRLPNSVLVSLDSSSSSSTGKQ